IRIRVRHRWMDDLGGADLHAVELADCAARLEFMHAHELAQIRTLLVVDADVDVVRHREEETVDDLPQRRRPPYVDRLAPTTRPNVVTRVTQRRDKSQM